jgi:putative adhesin
MNNRITLAALATTLLACILAVPAHANDCKHTTHRTATSAGPDIKRVVVEAGAGDLVVRGGDSGEVKVDGRACASTAELLDGIQVEIRRDGDTVYVRTVLPDSSNVVLFGFSRYAYLDVTVDVPKTATMKIDDSSGDMRVSDVNGAAITDSSGDQTLEHIAGDLDVADSSGEIHITDVRGGLRLRDSSGDIDVDNVQGDVLVTVDSSGDMDIRHVTGGVHIVNDSSGDIEVQDVKRDVIIDEDSSGGIVVHDVGGSFTVGSDGSGGIRYDRVAGTVHLPSD